MPIKTAVSLLTSRVLCRSWLFGPAQIVVTGSSKRLRLLHLDNKTYCLVKTPSCQQASGYSLRCFSITITWTRKALTELDANYDGRVERAEWQNALSRSPSTRIWWNGTRKTEREEE